MKLQSIFVSYLLLPILSIILGIITLLLNKKNQIISNKNLIVFAIVLSFVVALPSIFTFTGTDFIPLYYHIVQIFFLFLGFYYAKKINSFFINQNQLYTKSMSILVTLIILCIGSYLFSIIFNLFGEFEYGLLASTCTYTISIPIFLNWAYHSMLNIPSEIFKTWKYDTNYKEDHFTSDTIERVIIIELELSKQVHDKALIKVKAKAPQNFIFGDWFQLFIHDHNIKYCESPIHYYSINNKLDEWIFYIKPKFFIDKKHIDFEKTIEENQLTENHTTIVCKRVNFIS